jgi:hypothetical protein
VLCVRVQQCDASNAHSQAGGEGDTALSNGSQCGIGIRTSDHVAGIGHVVGYYCSAEKAVLVE